MKRHIHTLLTLLVCVLPIMQPRAEEYVLNAYENVSDDNSCQFEDTPAIFTLSGPGETLTFNASHYYKFGDGVNTGSQVFFYTSTDNQNWTKREQYTTKGTSWSGTLTISLDRDVRYIKFERQDGHKQGLKNVKVTKAPDIDLPTGTFDIDGLAGESPLAVANYRTQTQVTLTSDNPKFTFSNGTTSISFTPAEETGSTDIYVFSSATEVTSGTITATYTLSGRTYSKTITARVKAPQVITWNQDFLHLTLGGDDPTSVLLTAQNSTGNPITYTSSDESVVRVEGVTLYIVGAGAATLTASTPETSTQYAAEEAKGVFVRMYGEPCGPLVSEPDEFQIETGGSVHHDKTISWDAPAEQLTFDIYAGTGSSGSSYVYAYESTDCSGQATEIYSWSSTALSGIGQGSWKNGLCDISLRGRNYHSIRITSGSSIGLKIIRNLTVTPEVIFSTDSTSFSVTTNTLSPFDRVLHVSYANQPNVIRVSHSNQWIQLNGKDTLMIGDGCGDYGQRTINIRGLVGTTEGDIRDTITFEADGTVLKSIPIVMHVSKRAQTLSWNQTLGTVSITDTVSLTGATTTSELPPAFYSDDAGVNISGSTVSFTAYGNFTIKAVQAGDNYFAQSNTVSKTITVLPNTEADLTWFSISGFGSSVDPADGSTTLIDASQQMNIKAAAIRFRVSPYASLRIGGRLMTQGETYNIYEMAQHDAEQNAYTLPDVSVTSQDGLNTRTYTIVLMVLPTRAAFLTPDGSLTGAAKLYERASRYYGTRLNIISMADPAMTAEEKADSIIKWYDVVIMPHYETVNPVYRQLAAGLDGNTRLICFQYELAGSQYYTQYGWPGGSVSDQTSTGFTKIVASGINYDNYDLFRRLTFDAGHQVDLGATCHSLTLNNATDWKMRTAEGTIWEQPNTGFKKAIVLAIDAEAALSGNNAQATRRHAPNRTESLNDAETLIDNLFTYEGTTTYYDETRGVATRLSHTEADRVAHGIEGVSIEGHMMRNKRHQQLNVFTITGQLILTSRTDIDMQRLPQGIYIVRGERGMLQVVR